MDARRIPWSGRVAIAVMLPSVLVLSSCGSDSSDDNAGSGTSPAATSTGSDAKACQDVQDLRTSISQLKDVPLNKDGLSTLSTKLDQIRTQVHQLATDAHGSVKPEVDQLSASVDALKADVQAAVQSPSGTTLSALPSALAAVGTAAQNVRSALPNC
jgi:hypothetical protein